MPTRNIPEWYVRSSIAPSTGREKGRVVTGVDEILWGNVRHITPQTGLENPNAPMFASASVLCIPGQRPHVHIERRVDWMSMPIAGQDKARQG